MEHILMKWVHQFSISTLILSLVVQYSSGLVGNGSQCSEHQPCPDGKQECFHGFCRCMVGLITVHTSCLPGKSFNESCEDSAQCVDFRMKCSGGRCSCVKYYQWDGYSKQCTTLKDLSYMLSDMEEKYDIAGKLSVDTHAIFTSLVWTGVAVMVTGAVLAIGCVFYTCCYQRWSKKSGKGPETVRPSSVVPASRSTFLPAGESRSKSATEGTCDFIPGLYQTSSFDVI